MATAVFSTLKAYEIPEKRKLITKMAKYYTSLFGRKVTIEDVARKFGVSRNTVSKYFNKDLPMIDQDLANKVYRKRDKAIRDNLFKSKQ